MVAVGASGLVAFFHRPSTAALLIAMVAVVAGWTVHTLAAWSTRATIEDPTSDHRPPPLSDGSTEAPAVVGLLTNDFLAPNAAVTATIVDLAARGWVRLSSVDGDVVVVTRTSAVAGDPLRPFEQQVFNHLVGQSFNGAVSGATLAGAHRRLTRRWWRGFRRAVANDSERLGLSTRRYSAAELLPTAALVAVALFAWWISARVGDEIAIADSWRSRALWLLTLISIVALVRATINRALGSEQRPTRLGQARTTAWFGYRSRLRDRIPEYAHVLAEPPQQRALAQAAVMGVAHQVLHQVPVVPENHRRAWSEAGPRPHLVKVRYPVRPGYGQHPVKVGITGLVVLLLSRWAQGFLTRVADGTALESWLDDLPGQIEIFTTIAEVLSLILWIPVVWAVWALVAGAVDSIVTQERIGEVVRSRRPAEVLHPLVHRVINPVADRGRFLAYLAVDDGKRRSVAAWLADERSAAPQGAQARVRATPLLGYVRSSEPIGTATRTTD